MTDASIDLTELNVLLVDDCRHMRLINKSVLLALGCKKVKEAGDAAEAFKLLLHFPADILIVDWYMSPLDGLEFVRLVRTARDSPNPYVPIIMVSGYTEYSRITEARDAGVNEFLAKPISVSGLGNRIVSLINNERPFIRTKNYFGPCRRRKNDGAPAGIGERRKPAQAVEEPSDDDSLETTLS